MRLNTISAHEGARKAKTRCGRGIGSGLGKTCGRGHKGYTSRSGSGRKVGFEGGQMPLQRRLPKRGFNSYAARVTDEIRLNELNNIEADIINLDVLRKAGLISSQIKDAKIILSGEITKAVNIEGLRVTKGAKEAIEKAGGKVA